MEIYYIFILFYFFSLSLKKKNPIDYHFIFPPYYNRLGREKGEKCKFTFVNIYRY